MFFSILVCCLLRTGSSYMRIRRVENLFLLPQSNLVCKIRFTKNLFAQFMSIDVTLKVIIDASKSDKKRSVRYNFSISINSSLLFPGSREWLSIPVSNQEDPDLLPGSAAPAALPQHHSLTKSSVEAFTLSLLTHFHSMWIPTIVTERGGILLVWIKT